MLPLKMQDTYKGEWFSLHDSQNWLGKLSELVKFLFKCCPKWTLLSFTHYTFAKIDNKFMTTDWRKTFYLHQKRKIRILIFTPSEQ